MASLPVICDKCGIPFVTQSAIGGSGTVTLEDVGVGPCPACGGMGRIPNGTYRLTNYATTLLQGPQRTKDELRRFADILRPTYLGQSGPPQQQSKMPVD